MITFLWLSICKRRKRKKKSPIQKPNFSPPSIEDQYFITPLFFHANPILLLIILFSFNRKSSVRSISLFSFQLLHPISTALREKSVHLSLDYSFLKASASRHITLAGCRTSLSLCSSFGRSPVSFDLFVCSYR